MSGFLIGVILVPAIDQAVKRLVCARVGSRAIPLGGLGELRPVHTRIWAMRVGGSTSLRAMWTAWAGAAAISAAVSVSVPEAEWWFGLMVGGALSHALETSVRGTICDYVCLRFWPAFNVADVAIVAGAAGLLFALAGAV